MDVGEKCRAAVLVEPGRMSVMEFDLPEVGPDEGLLQVEMVGVCGTDYGFYKGKIQDRRYPMIPGHEILGRIARIGPAAAAAYGVKAGDRVVVQSSIRCGRCPYCVSGEYQLCENRRSYGTTMPTSVPPALWGAFSTYMYLAPGSLIHRVSEAVPAEAAVLTCAVLANGLRWVLKMGQLRAGEAVVVQGVGPQGLAGIIAAREGGASPIVATGLTADHERFGLARLFGADHVIDVDREDVVARVAAVTAGRMANVVLDVTGAPQAIAGALDLVAKQGRIVQAGLSGATHQTPLVMDKLIFKEARIQGVLTHNMEAVQQAVRLVDSGRYPLEQMVTHRFPLEEAERAIRTVGREIQTAAVKVVLVP